MLWRRAPQIDRLTTITIAVGVIGGLAMVGALFLGIILFMRIRRESQQRRNALETASQDIVHFPTISTAPVTADSFAPQPEEKPYQHSPPPPRAPRPQPQRRQGDAMVSAWFADNEDDHMRTDQAEGTGTSRGRQRLGTTSRRDINVEQTPRIPEATNVLSIPRARGSEPESTPSGANSHIPPSLPLSTRRDVNVEQPPSIPEATNVPKIPRARGSEPESTPSGFNSHIRPSLPLSPREPQRPPSPILFREAAIIVPPRARESSLHRKPPPTLPAPAGHHVMSASEDYRAVSRFSISPVARSFPARLTALGSSPLSPKSPPSASRSHHKGLHRFGSLPSLVHPRSESTSPDVPTPDSQRPRRP